MIYGLDHLSELLQHMRDDDIFPGGPPSQGGSLKLLSAGADNLKVRWDPPGGVERINYFLVHIGPALGLPARTAPKNISAAVNSYHFKNLKPKTPYNVTVEGGALGRILWHVRRRFQTTDTRKIF